MTPVVTLRPIDVGVLRLMACGDLVGAGRATGLTIPPTSLDSQWVWGAFAARTVAEPQLAEWHTQYFVVEDERIVGDVRLLGPPQDGEVAIGYQVVPIERGRGVATAAGRLLLELAATRPDVHRVFALVNPANAASLAVCRHLGLVDVGEQLHRHPGTMMRRLERELR